MKKSLACLLVALTSGCPSVQTSPPGTAGPLVEFDPANNIVPFPNNLALNPATGKVNLPAQACESPTSKLVREQVLNQLDGFGTFEVGLQLTLTAPPDPASLATSVTLYKRASGTTPITTATPVPISVQATKTLRFAPSACTMPAMIDAITIVPLVPLDQKSTYTVAVTNTLKTADGKDFLPSSTWSLVRQKADPVTLASSGHCSVTTATTCMLPTDCPATESCYLDVLSEETPLDPSTPAGLAQLNGLDLLWKAHAQAMAFLVTAAGADPANVLLAWDFTTQTTTNPLDPAIAGSPAATLSNHPLLAPNANPGVFSVAAASPFPCNPGAGCTVFFTQVAKIPCGPGGLPCDAVGDILGAGLAETSYQVPFTNPLDATKPIPGPWSDPVAPTPQGGAALATLAFIPNSAAPAGGWPVIVFGHGLGSSKESLFAIAAQFAKAGFASVAIDFQAHGSRAVRTSNDPALGCTFGHCSTTTTTSCFLDGQCPAGEACTGATPPTAAPQCYAPFLSSNLATNRDNIRQTVLDLQRLVLAVKACGAAACPSINNASVFSVNPARIAYAGISLGGIIGSTTTSVAADIKAAVLNVPGMGWLDILENTQTLQISCTLVDALIDAGILVGAKFDPVAMTGLCTTNAWQMQPGYQQFRGIARWVLDPADGANFASKLAAKRFLIQEVVGDQVVPNIATDDEGKLVGLTPMTADVFLPVCASGANMGNPCANDTQCPASKCLADPSDAVVNNLMSTKWMRYPTLPANAGTGFPGNTFEHASLLRPAATTPPAAGQLGTGRLQTDAITFLFGNDQ